MNWYCVDCRPKATTTHSRPCPDCCGFAVAVAERPMSPAPESPWVSILDVALECRISERTVRRMIADGTLPAFRLGKRLVRIRREDAAALIQRIGATT